MPERAENPCMTGRKNRLRVISLMNNKQGKPFLRNEGKLLNSVVAGTKKAYRQQ